MEAHTHSYTTDINNKLKTFPCLLLKAAFACKSMYKLNNMMLAMSKKLNIKAEMMQTVMKRKLGLFGHICRMEDSRKSKV